MDTLIFDIGKTNKKVIVFDRNFNQVYKSYQYFEPIFDADGFPCENLDLIVEWIAARTNEIINSSKYDIGFINFSTYGASLVHLDHKDNIISPFYNYLKPLPKEYTDEFYKKYGAKDLIALQTASPALGMLNSGLQLFWLKKSNRKFEEICYSLHFPQFLSYLFTGMKQSEYTSIGCHTALWNFKQKDYHSWVYNERIDLLFAPIVSTNTLSHSVIAGKQIKVGVGIHDSSAALLPYIYKERNKSFVLISTGTWSISINPFNQAELSSEELQRDCLHFMGINGESVKAARIFLGEEFKYQVQQIQSNFNCAELAKSSLDPVLMAQASQLEKGNFRYKYLKTPWSQPDASNWSEFDSPMFAYHLLMLELVHLQIKSTQLVIGKNKIEKMYIDGGFAQNDLFVTLIKDYFNTIPVIATESPLGSALGAAQVMRMTDSY